MQLLRNRFFLLTVLISFSVISWQCSIVRTIANLSRLKFKIDNVDNVGVAGVTLSGIRSVSDIGTIDILKLTTAIARGSLPVQLTINVAALNPNDGKGGYPSTNAYLKEFPYRLMIEGNEVLSGNLENPVTIPGTGETSMIPLTVSFDLLKISKDKSWQSLVDLALGLAGAGSKGVNLELKALPVVTTDFGDIAYPREITIVKGTF